MVSEAKPTNLDLVAKESQNVLFETKAVFPFQLFPDSITVDQNKTVIVYRYFFWTKYVFTVIHADLKSIKVSMGPIFATVYFEVKGYEENPTPVSYLRKNDAIKLQEIVTGMNIANKRKASIKSDKPKALNRKLRRVGRVHDDVNAPI